MQLLTKITNMYRIVRVFSKINIRVYGKLMFSLHNFKYCSYNNREDQTLRDVTLKISCAFNWSF